MANAVTEIESKLVELNTEKDNILASITKEVEEVLMKLREGDMESEMKKIRNEINQLKESLFKLSLYQSLSNQQYVERLLLKKELDDKCEISQNLRFIKENYQRSDSVIAIITEEYKSESTELISVNSRIKILEELLVSLKKAM